MTTPQPAAAWPCADIVELSERLPDPHARDALGELADVARGDLLWRLVDALPPCQAALMRRAFAAARPTR